MMHLNSDLTLETILNVKINCANCIYNIREMVRTQNKVVTSCLIRQHPNMLRDKGGLVTNEESSYKEVDSYVCSQHKLGKPVRIYAFEHLKSESTYGLQMLKTASNNPDIKLTLDMAPKLAESYGDYTHVYDKQTKDDTS